MSIQTKTLKPPGKDSISLNAKQCLELYQAATEAEQRAFEIKRIREKCLLSLESFAHTVFPHYCTVPSSKFHHEAGSRLCEKIRQGKGSRTARAAPRDSAKSTLFSRFLPLWCACYSQEINKHFALLGSFTSTQAERFLRDIKYELEGNVLLAAVFPEVVGEGPVWKADEICTNNGFWINAVGTGGSILGISHGPYRPDILIGDDLEKQKHRKSPLQREEIEDWILKTFCKCGIKTADQIFAGTIQHYDSPLSRMLANPAYDSYTYRGVVRWSKRMDLWEEWERLYVDGTVDTEQREAQADRFFAANRGKMLEGSEVLWPEYKDYYDYAKLRVAEGPASFDSEIQNEPINPEDCLFQEEWFHWFDEDNLVADNHIRVAACDPSMGKAGKHHDPSALVCLGVDSKGILYVLDADIQRRVPDQIIDDAIELHQNRKLSILGVEETQFQEFFKDRMLQVAQERKVHLPIQGIKSTTDKVIRIQRLQPLVKNGTLRFQKRHKVLYDQLRFFPLADHDDGPDALEMAVQMAERLTSPRDIRTVPTRHTKRKLQQVYGL